MSKMTVEEAQKKLREVAENHRRAATEDWISSPSCVDSAAAIETILAHVDQQASEIDAKDAEIARLTKERDRLIERWPGDGSPGDSVDIVNGKYAVIRDVTNHVTIIDSPVGRFTDRVEAVRYAAGLDQTGGEHAET